jgi:hypothetical protein
MLPASHILRLLCALVFCVEASPWDAWTGLWAPHSYAAQRLDIHVSHGRPVPKLELLLSFLSTSFLCDCVYSFFKRLSLKHTHTHTHTHAQRERETTSIQSFQDGRSSHLHPPQVGGSKQHQQPKQPRVPHRVQVRWFRQVWQLGQFILWNSRLSCF